MTKEWTCPKCGKQKLTGNFCVKCGTKNTCRRYCIKCRREIEDEFCEDCGTKAAEIIDKEDYIEVSPAIGNINMISKETPKEPKTWEEAIEYAKNLKTGGFPDWRLPTKEELDTIYDIENDGWGCIFNNGFWCSQACNNEKHFVWEKDIYGE